MSNETLERFPITDPSARDLSSGQWRAALDNYEVTRSWARGQLVHYSTDRVTGAVVLLDAEDLKDATDAVYLLDDGRTVRPLYVAAWHPDSSHLILHPFPTNYDEDGAQRTRPDGRPVEFTHWMLGPRRAYHLKVS